MEHHGMRNLHTTRQMTNWLICAVLLMWLACQPSRMDHVELGGHSSTPFAALDQASSDMSNVTQRDSHVHGDTGSVFPLYHYETNNRRQRFLSIFSIVTFQNIACRATPRTTAIATPSTVTVTTAAPTTSDGTCVSLRQCRRTGGQVAGTCASGYGSCCLYELSCGASTQANVTYFINSEYPDVSNAPRSCVMLINKSNLNVVQLRLDFENFRLNGVTNGLCASDALTVTGQNADNRIPLICGMNDGQHAYVNVGESTGPIMLAVTTSGAGSRQWRIKVTQLERGNPLLAPTECLQYFTGTSGLLKSFNFDSPAPPIGQANYINDLNYALCVRREAGSCMIRYTASPNQASSFDLDLPDVMSGLDGSCIGDFLFIPGGGNAPPAMAGPIGSRFCGAALSATAGAATSNPIINNLAGPIQLAFVTNANAPTGISNRGFSIQYQQIPCTGSG